MSHDVVAGASKIKTESQNISFKFKVSIDLIVQVSIWCFFNIPVLQLSIPWKTLDTPISYTSSLPKSLDIVFNLMDGYM